MKLTYLYSFLIALSISCSSKPNIPEETELITELTESLPMVNAGHVMLVDHIFKLDVLKKNLIIEQHNYDFEEVPLGHIQFSMIPLKEIDPKTMRIIKEGAEVGLMIDKKKASLGFLISNDLSEERNEENTVDWHYLGGFPKGNTKTLEKIKQEIFYLMKHNENNKTAS